MSYKDYSVLQGLAEAAQDAKEWFDHFGYNRFGIAVSDDNRDFEPIRDLLQVALERYQEVANATP